MKELIKIHSKNHPNIELKAIHGHFVTPSSHINYFLDMTTMKTRLSEASTAAKGTEPSDYAFYRGRYDRLYRRL